MYRPSILWALLIDCANDPPLPSFHDRPLSLSCTFGSFHHRYHYPGNPQSLFQAPHCVMLLSRTLSAIAQLFIRIFTSRLISLFILLAPSRSISLSLICYSLLSRLALWVLFMDLMKNIRLLKESLELCVICAPTTAALLAIHLHFSYRLFSPFISIIFGLKYWQEMPSLTFKSLFLAFWTVVDFRF